MILPPERAGHAPPDDLTARRAGLMAAVAAGYWHTDPAPTDAIIGGVRCLRFDPGGPARGTVIHMHGGAFRIGCPEQIAPFALRLAQSAALTVICPAYRLAPEHPFPAALNDGWAVLRALAQTATGPLILSGDSAGGGLAASLASCAGRAGIALAGLALLSPWLDLTVTDPAYARNADSDPLFSAESAGAAAMLYLQGHPADDPLASAVRGDLRGYPPSWINVGAGEVLAGDAQRLHAQLAEADVPASLHIVDGMEHVAVTRDMTLTGSAETFAALVAFLDQALRAP